MQVEALTVVIDAGGASVSQLVNQKQVEQLPLHGRSFVHLLFIGAGEVQTVGKQGR